MAEVLYLGRKKVRSINDILGTPYIGELLVCFVEGKLEKWMNEERATYLKYLKKLALLDKKLCSDTIEQIKDFFEIGQDVKIIRNQREFEKAMEDEEITNFILLGGEYYMIRGKISKKSKILVGFENDKPIIDVGYTFEKKFGDLVDCVNVDLNSVRVSTEDLVVFIQTNNLSIEEKIELINGVEITESNQELIRIKIDCLQEKGEISEAIETIEELTDEGERLFYLFDIKDRSSDNRKELIEKYLKPAVDKGNIQAIEKYVKILKDGNKAQKKEAFDILKKMCPERQYYLIY